MSEQSLQQIVYISSSVKLATDAELLELLEQSRERNLQFDITGMLLYRDGLFIQAIEGVEKPLRTLFSNIQRDPRHTGLKTLVDREIIKRDFHSWSMGFANVSGYDEETVPAFSSFLAESHSQAKSHSRAIHLLQTFREVP